MNVEPAGDLLAYLRQIPDPRGAQGRRHSLSAMLAAVVCSILCGARGYAAIAQWLGAHPPEVWHLLGFTRRPPKWKAFRDLLIKLDPSLLEDALRRWIGSVLPDTSLEGELQVVSLDGKTLCGTLAAHGRSVHLLSLFDHQTGCILSQMPVPGDTNEAKAALKILHSVVLRGKVVTGDAMFCQREICQATIDSGGDYLFVVKDNQRELKEAIAGDFLTGFSPLHGEGAATPPFRGDRARQVARPPHHAACTGQHADRLPSGLAGPEAGLAAPAR